MCYVSKIAQSSAMPPAPTIMISIVKNTEAEFSVWTFVEPSAQVWASLFSWLTEWTFGCKIFENNLLKSISQWAIKLCMGDNRIELHNRVNLIKPCKLRRHPNIGCGNGGEPLVREHLCMGHNRIKLHNKASQCTPWTAAATHDHRSR